jgi:hypothetical protein
MDYRIKNKKKKFGRITFLIYNNPFSHCVERRVFEKRISLGTLIRADMKGVWYEVN